MVRRCCRAGWTPVRVRDRSPSPSWCAPGFTCSGPPASGRTFRAAHMRTCVRGPPFVPRRPLVRPLCLAFAAACPLGTLPPVRSPSASLCIRTVHWDAPPHTHCNSSPRRAQFARRDGAEIMCARLSQTQRNATHAIVRVVSCRAAPRRSACNAMQCNVCTERCVRLLASPLERARCVASRDAISNTNVCLRRGECTIAHTVSLSPLLSSLAFYLRLRQRLKQCNAVQYITLRCTGQYTHTSAFCECEEPTPIRQWHRIV